MARAVAVSTARGLFGQNTNPSASAPALDGHARVLRVRDAADLHRHRLDPRAPRPARDGAAPRSCSRAAPDRGQHEALADEEGVEAGVAQAADLAGAAQAALRHRDDVVRDRARRGRARSAGPRPACSGSRLLTPTMARLPSASARSRSSASCTSKIASSFASFTRRRQQSRRLTSLRAATIRSTASAPTRALRRPGRESTMKSLRRIGSERGRRASREVLDAAAEELLLGEHRERGRAGRLVGLRATCAASEVLAQDAARGRAPLELGDDVDVPARLQRGGEGRRRAGLRAQGRRGRAGAACAARPRSRASRTRISRDSHAAAFTRATPRRTRSQQRAPPGRCRSASAASRDARLEVLHAARDERRRPRCRARRRARARLAVQHRARAMSAFVARVAAREVARAAQAEARVARGDRERAHLAVLGRAITRVGPQSEISSRPSCRGRPSARRRRAAAEQPAISSVELGADTPTTWRRAPAGLVSGPEEVEDGADAELRARRHGVAHRRGGSRARTGTPIPTSSRQRSTTSTRRVDRHAERFEHVGAAAARSRRSGCRAWPRARRTPPRPARRRSRC